jgi:hypothetical protein
MHRKNLIEKLERYNPVDEKDLEKRFGDDYLQYKRNVPRWIPRLSAWKQK